MRHRKAGRKFGRNSAHRKSLIRNQTTSLLKHGQIKTTLAKAKELRRFVEPAITLGKNHAWSLYANEMATLNATLESLAPLFANASAEAQAVLAVVVESNAKVEGRFPSGLGALIKACKEVEGASAHLEALNTVRTAQMARQQALGQATAMVTEKAVVELLFGELAERYVSRNGGYTRVVKAGNREGDNAPMAYIALVNDAAEA